MKTNLKKPGGPGGADGYIQDDWAILPWLRVVRIDYEVIATIREPEHPRVKDGGWQWHELG